MDKLQFNELENCLAHSMKSMIIQSPCRLLCLSQYKINLNIQLPLKIDKMKKKNILIVGAGPVGLSAAWFLSSVPHLTIDIVQKYPLNDRQIFSKALNINSRTMELFNKTDIQAEFLDKSFKVSKIKISTKDKVILQKDIEKTLGKKTKFPNMHIYPQTLTERTIQQNLNKRKIYVQRQKEVIDAKNSSNALNSKVWVSLRDNKTGSIQHREYDYLLATDGAHSTIRKMFGLKFDGETLNTNIYLCDADIEGSPQECTEALVDGENFVIIVPIRENQVRLMGNSPQYLESIPESKFKILRRNWRSEFVINNRVIEKMSLGNVYFAGDSAHVHAPLGNRGMNLGIEDVYIFAKLLEQGSVEKYNEVRHETVKRFVAKVNELCKKAFAYEKTWKKWLLPYIAPLVNQMIKNDILLFITGLDYPLPPFAKL